MDRSIFANISPLDHRYSISEKSVFDALVPWLSEQGALAACIKAEGALIAAHLKVRGRYSGAASQIIDDCLGRVTPDEVYEEEEKTHHNIRALVNVIKSKLPPDLKPLVHLGATSADILDTSLAYRVKGATVQVLLPLLADLECKLCDFAAKEADTPQVGRTHGQHAVPITLGFAFAEYVSRLGKSILEIKRLSAGLKGKLAGAVGAYNATSMIVRDPVGLETLYLAELGLEPSEHSTQLVEPEYLLRLLLEFNTAFGILANLADDLRHLQRSEIGELKEGFADTQVGSSTMPQKRNPWNSEHIKSLWKAFMPRVVTFYMDQISEHQRDLSNSASQRFVAEYIDGFAMAVSRMSGLISGLFVDKERLLANLSCDVMAEPAYILLAESGVPDAHEIIRRITLCAEKEGISFVRALQNEGETLRHITAKMAELGIIGTNSTDDSIAFLQSPQKYRGLAAEKALSLAKKYKTIMENL
ncbi:MAG: adenylosuccinate lyase [Spirochaetaceae bacterium]|nr:adenylosuccinate lyase [Spirochaetaceae bacterium]